MNIVIVGAGTLGVQTARRLIRNRHNVVLIDEDRSVLEELADELDCGFIHGNGAKPSILKEVGPEKIDALLCLSSSDEDNILAALVGRSLGFGRVIPKIQDAGFETVCAELGLNDTIIPDHSIARHLADMVEGGSDFDLSATVHGDARLISIRIRDKGPGSLKELELPEKTGIVCVFRDDEFLLPRPELELKKGDQITLITDFRNLDRLREQWAGFIKSGSGQ